MVKVPAVPTMRHSFTGRVRNFNLPPTASNALMPIFEAMTNSLYAIQERFPDDWPDEGVITVRLAARLRPLARAPAGRFASLHAASPLLRKASAALGAAG